MRGYYEICRIVGTQAQKGKNRRSTPGCSGSTRDRELLFFAAGKLPELFSCGIPTDSSRLWHSLLRTCDADDGEDWRNVALIQLIVRRAPAYEVALPIERLRHVSVRCCKPGFLPRWQALVCLEEREKIASESRSEDQPEPTPRLNSVLLAPAVSCGLNTT